MSYRMTFILFVIDQLNGERSISGAYHLLKGKRSQQSIQDAKWYGLTRIYRTMPTLTKKDLARDIDMLKQKRLIYEITDDMMRVTEDGKKMLDSFVLPEHLDGFTYGQMSEIFWKRFVLFTQSLSSLLYGKGSFLPVITDESVMKWVKRHFPKGAQKRTQWAEQLYNECLTFLIHEDAKKAEMFTSFLSSYSAYGMTIEQYAFYNNQDTFECLIEFQSLLHHLIETITKEKKQYHYLYLFLSDLTKPYALTDSAYETYRMLKNGSTMDEISKRRGLKMGTIEDHLVEIALNVSSFSIDLYVPKSLQANIMGAIRSLNTRRLKMIKNELNDGHISYFQIRLVLAKVGVGDEN